jgi:hypothetical protein
MSPMPSPRIAAIINIGGGRTQPHIFLGLKAAVEIFMN